MKRLSLLLLPVLIWAALNPVASLPSAAAAVGGAAFTTVNVAIDGPGHCRNGNPLVNCNLYNGMEYVWLNGGPKGARLRPDGAYFFAVLAPGGQNTPNDGGAKNLSDNFDAYTNRTFTVKNGKVSAYSGTHTFDRGLIRLSPYANTPNKGGVYMLAICSLVKGYPVKASACKYDQFKVTATACVPQVQSANFAVYPPSTSVKGMDKVVTGLDIESLDTTHEVEVIAPDVLPKAYDAGSGTINAGLDPGFGGFSDVTAAGANPGKPGAVHHYIFNFAKPVSNFTLRMLDFGDFNPPVNGQFATDHSVTIQAFSDRIGSSNALVDQQSLQYSTKCETKDPMNPTCSDLYGDLQITGDAVLSAGGKPGNWIWHVSGPGILMVKLDEGMGFDPNIGFDLLSFTTTCP